MHGLCVGDKLFVHERCPETVAMEWRQESMPLMHTRLPGTHAFGIFFCLILIRINTFQFCGKFHCFLSSIFFGTWVGDVGMYFCVVMSTGCRGG